MKLGKLRKWLEPYSDDADISIIDKEQDYCFEIDELREVFLDGKEYVELVIDMDFLNDR